MTERWMEKKTRGCWDAVGNNTDHYLIQSFPNRLQTRLRIKTHRGWFSSENVKTHKITSRKTALLYL